MMRLQPEGVKEDRRRRYDNIRMLEDTLGVFKKGSYVKDGRTIYTKLSGRQMKECHVFLPEKVREIMNSIDAV